MFLIYKYILIENQFVIREEVQEHKDWMIM